MGIVNGNGCELQRRGERKNEFGEERQKLFLGHLADSCNIKAAARTLGLVEQRLFNWVKICAFVPGLVHHNRR